MGPNCTKISKVLTLSPLEQKLLKRSEKTTKRCGLIGSANSASNITYTTYVVTNKSTMIAP